MRIAWERIATLVVGVGAWAVILIGSRYAAHLMHGEVRTLAHLAIGQRGRFV